MSRRTSEQGDGVSGQVDNNPSSRQATQTTFQAVLLTYNCGLIQIASLPTAYVYEPVGNGEIRILNLLPDAFEATLNCSLERRTLPVLDSSANRDYNLYEQVKQEFFEKLTSDVDLQVLVVKLGNGTLPPDDKSYLEKMFQNRYAELVETGLRQGIMQKNINSGYEALSYVWGDPEDTVSILCSGCEVKVTRNLGTALKYLRNTKGVRQLWVDAICINQQDLTEKGQQVQQMGRVYASADRTLVWLGEEHPEDKDALEQLPNWLESPKTPNIDWDRAQVVWESPSSFLFNEQDVSNEVATWLRCQQVCLPSILHLFSREWWRRKWIIQELVLAKHVVLICGYQHLDWSLIQRHLGGTSPSTSVHLARIYLLVGQMPDIYELRHKSQNGLVNADQLAGFVWGFRLKDKPDPSRPGLMELALRTIGFHCTVAVDRLYSLLTLAEYDIKLSNRPDLLEVDYRAGFVAVSIRFTQWLLLNRPDLVPLDFVLGNRMPFISDKTCLDPDRQQKSKSAQNPNQQLPTWVSSLFHPDYLSRRDLVTPFTIVNADGHPFSGGIPRTDLTYWTEPSTGGAMLGLKGRIIGTITNLVPEIHVANHPYSYGELKAWTVKILDLISIHAPNDGQTHEMFYQLVTCGGEKSGAMSIAISPKQRPSLEDAQDYLATILDKQGSLYSDINSRTFLDSMAPALCRKLCTTSSGNIGWVPPIAEIGDQISVFDGARLPHVIASCGGGYHNLIGSCYLQGLMYGEVLDVEAETINLY